MPSSAGEIEAKDLILQMEEQMNKAGVVFQTDSKQFGITAATPVNMGTNVTFSTANSGNSGYSGSGVGTHGEGFSAIDNPQWADSGVYLNSLGNVGSWAWVGNTILINGSGSRSATITFSGQYSGNIYQAGNASASAKIRMSIQNTSNGSELGAITLIDTSASGNYQNSYTKSVTVILQAGQTYALRMGVSTAASCSIPALHNQSSATFCNTNTYGDWTPGKNGEGINYTSIAIKWN